MPSLPLYIDLADATDLLGFLNRDTEIAFIENRLSPIQAADAAPGAEARYYHRAVESLAEVADGRYCLWHVPTGPLPLPGEPGKPNGSIENAWDGWTDHRSHPTFGPGHPGIVWWNVYTNSFGRGGPIGISSFEWIGNHYRIIGSPADPRTGAWWARLRRYVKKRARRIPREGSIDGPNPEIFTFLSALTKIQSGVERAGN